MTGGFRFLYSPGRKAKVPLPRGHIEPMSISLLKRLSWTLPWLCAWLIGVGCSHLHRPPESDEQRFARLSDSAEAGDVKAQYELGRFYEEGRMVGVDFEETARLYLLAAGRGLADAQYALGHLCQTGRGVATNYAQAFRWFSLAADQNHAGAQVALGTMYATGMGAEQNLDKALELYRKSTARGNARAQHNLGVMYQRGWGVRPDEHEAWRWFSAAAGQGDPEALYRLGLLCETRDEGSPDYWQSGELYLESAEKGYVPAMVAIGRACEYGLGVRRDPAKAESWYLQAAERGNSEAALSLGFFYRQDIASSNLPQSVLWFARAAEAGQEAAYLELESLSSVLVRDGKVNAACEEAGVAPYLRSVSRKLAGDALRKQKRLDKAAAAYEEAVTLATRLEPPYEWLARVYAALGEIAKASNVCRQAEALFAGREAVEEWTYDVMKRVKWMMAKKAPEARPPAAAAPDRKHAAEVAAESVARQYYEALKSRDFEKALSYCSPRLFQRIPRDRWKADLEDVQAKAGELRSFELVSASAIAGSAASRSEGIARLQFNVTYGNLPAVETLTLHRQAEGDFRIVRHENSSEPQGNP